MIKGNRISKKLIVILIAVFIVIFLTSFLLIGTVENIPKNVVFNKIIVFKKQHTLNVFSNDKLIKTYKRSIGRGGLGSKQFEGDEKTPEGVYFISGKNNSSGYHNNLAISYPNRNDIERCKKLNKPTGGDIKIHGLKNGFGFIGKVHLLFDWTLGCIAVTNDEIDELYEHTPIGTVIEIKP